MAIYVCSMLVKTILKKQDFLQIGKDVPDRAFIMFKMYMHNDKKEHFHKSRRIK